MKGKPFITILIIAGILTSCNPNSGNTPSSFEQQFLGNWFLKRKTENGNNVQTTTDTAHCKVRFTDEPIATKFFCSFGITDCLLKDYWWTAASPYIDFGGINYEIINQTNTSLTLRNVLSADYEYVYQLEKNYSDLYTSCTFTYSVEFNDPIPLGYNGSKLYLTYTDNNGLSQSVDMTGLTSWSQTVSQNFGQSLHTYNYLLEFANQISVNNGGNNWGTLATFKISDSNGNIIGQFGPQALCLNDINNNIDCTNETEPYDFSIELNCTN